MIHDIDVNKLLVSKEELYDTKKLFVILYWIQR